MKLALVFLSAFVVISHQQFHQPLRGMRWMPYSQQRVLQNYYQPHYYDNFDEDESPYYRQFRPSRPVAYLQVSLKLTFEADILLFHEVIFSI